jgi:hypothetical protein
MKILDYHSPITPFTVYIVGDWFSFTFKQTYKIPEYIVCGLRAIHIENFCEEVEFLCDELSIDKEPFISYILSAYDENKLTYPNEANNIDITLLTERQIDLVAIQATNIRIMKQLLRYRKRLSFYGLMENPNIPVKMVSQLIKYSGWCADHFVNTKYPFNDQQIDIIAKKYPDLLTKWLVLIDANQTLIEQYLPYVDSEDIYAYTIVDKLPQYFHEYTITQDNYLTVNSIASVAPNISFIIKRLDKICRDK